MRSAFAGLDLARDELLDAVVEGLRGARPLRGRVPHRVGERPQPADLGLLARRELGAPFLVGLARDEVLRVRAAVLDELALVEVQHARDRLVEQREVVADDEQRAAERAQERHQPRLGVDVEVVRRLVEQQEVAAREQDARELDAPALTTGERADREVEAVAGEPEARADAPHFGFGRVAARGAERVLGVAEGAHVARRRIVRRPAGAALRGDAAAASRPRPESTCASAVPSRPAPRGGGSCGR